MKCLSAIPNRDGNINLIAGIQSPRSRVASEMRRALESFQRASTETALVPRSTWLMYTGWRSALSAKDSWLRPAFRRK